MAEFAVLPVEVEEDGACHTPEIVRVTSLSCGHSRLGHSSQVTARTRPNRGGRSRRQLPRLYSGGELPSGSSNQDPIASVLTNPSRTTVTAVRECCAFR